MDLDFSTLLPIILGVLYYVFTGASKNKKKAQRPVTKDDLPGPESLGPPPVSRKPTFEELLEEFTGKSQDTVAEPEPELVKPPMITTKPVEPEPVPRVETHIRNHEPLVNFQEYEMEEEVEKEDYKEMFSDLDAAKRAFIASEIFNKKY